MTVTMMELVMKLMMGQVEKRLIAVLSLPKIDLHHWQCNVYRHRQQKYVVSWYP